MRGNGWTAMHRREMLKGLARWTVPSIVTIALGARRLQAIASCPPCTKLQAGKCKACTISQIMNCNCEPCLGPPYCPSAGAAAPLNPSVRAPGSTPFSAAPPGSEAPLSPSVLNELRRRRLQRMPGREPLYRDPFNTRRPGSTLEPPSLYDRLRRDTVTTRRRTL